MNSAYLHELSDSAFEMSESIRDMQADPTRYAVTARAWCEENIVRIANTLIQYAAADLEPQS